MPKNTRRVVVTRTVTFTATIDTPGYPEGDNATMLTVMGGANGAAGALSLGELLAGSISNNGTAPRGNWSVSGTSINVEPYISRPKNTTLTLGQRIVSLNPPATYEAARGKLFYVYASSGATANTDTEPNWTLTDGGVTTDGGASYYTLPKFPTLTTFVTATVYAVGTILRPSATSLKEFLVTAQTGAATTPTWTSNDTLNASFAAGLATLRCIAGCTTYAFSTVYALGDVVKPSAGSGSEYLCTFGGVSDTSALDTGSPAVGATVTRGTAQFKRIV